MGRKLTSLFSDNYECKHDWPENCFVQYGGNGIVFEKGTMKDTLDNPEEGLKNFFKAKAGAPSAPKHYRTAFFEAFPTNPDTFIRGEGKTVEEAEQAAWDRLQRYSACEQHEFERGTYRNGAGRCTKCNMFKSKVFEPLEVCVVCNKNTYWSSDKEGNWYCEEHNDKNPDRPEF